MGLPILNMDGYLLKQIKAETARATAADASLQSQINNIQFNALDLCSSYLVSPFNTFSKTDWKYFSARGGGYRGNGDTIFQGTEKVANRFVQENDLILKRSIAFLEIDAYTLGSHWSSSADYAITICASLGEASTAEDSWVSSSVTYQLSYAISSEPYEHRKLFTPLTIINPSDMPALHHRVEVPFYASCMITVVNKPDDWSGFPAADGGFDVRLWYKYIEE